MIPSHVIKPHGNGFVSSNTIGQVSRGGQWRYRWEFRSSRCSGDRRFGLISWFTGTCSREILGQKTLDQAIRHLSKGRDLSMQQLEVFLNLSGANLSHIGGESYIVLLDSLIRVYFSCHFFLVGRHFSFCARIVYVSAFHCFRRVRKTQSTGEDVKLDLSRFI